MKFVEKQKASDFAQQVLLRTISLLKAALVWMPRDRLRVSPAPVMMKAEGQNLQVCVRFGAPLYMVNLCWGAGEASYSADDTTKLRDTLHVFFLRFRWGASFHLFFSVSRTSVFLSSARVGTELLRMFVKIIHLFFTMLAKSNFSVSVFPVYQEVYILSSRL